MRSPRFHFKCYFVTACFLLLLLLVHAQPAIEWQKTYGNSTVQTAQGRNIVKVSDGYIFSQVGDPFLFTFYIMFPLTVTKVDLKGNLVWTRTIKPRNVTGDFVPVAPDDNNGIYYSAIVTDDPGRNADIIVGRLSGNGDSLWQMRLGGPANENLTNLIKTSDGGVMALGTYDTSGNRDIWVVKISATGQLQWDKKYGGTRDEFAQFIVEQSGGGYVFAGSARSRDGQVLNGNLGPNENDDFWVVSLDTDGNIIHQHALGGTGEEEPGALIQTPDGGFLVSGETTSSDGDVGGSRTQEDTWVVKLDNNLSISWKKVIGGNGLDYIHKLYTSGDGGYIGIGYTSSVNGDITDNHGDVDMWVVKFSAAGDLSWSKCFGGNGGDYEPVTFRSDGVNGYYITGATGIGTVKNGTFVDLPDTTTGNTWTAKLDKDGNILWLDAYKRGYDGVVAMLETADNGLMTSGWGVPVGSSKTDYDILLTKLCGGFPDSLVLTNGPYEICEGDSVQLVAKPGFFKYRWSTGDTTQSIFAKTAGKYRVTVFNPEGCSATSYPSVKVIVHPLPVKTVTLNGAARFCESDSLSIHAVASPARYLWNTGDTVQSIVVKTMGNYFAQLVNQFGCRNTSDTTHVIVLPLPDSPRITISHDTLFSTNAASYQWYIGAVPITGNRQQITISDTGNYYVRITDSSGCSQISAAFFVDNISRPLSMGNFVVLNGKTDLIQVPYNAALVPATITVEGWMKVDSSGSQKVGTNTSMQYITAMQRTGLVNSAALALVYDESSQRLMATAESSAGQQVTVQGNQSISIGSWYHFALSADNNQMKLYINGRMEAQVNTGFAIDFGTKPVCFGRLNNPQSDGFFKGSLDDIRIWNGVRSSVAIKSGFQAELNGSEAGLSGYWNMNIPGEGNGLTVPNKSVLGQSADGLAVGTLTTPIFTSFDALPVKLLYFRVKEVSSNPVIEWATTEEIQTSRFSAEYSDDGIHFQQFGSVPAIGGSQNAYYSLADPSVRAAITFYRLKIIDKDGKFSYSNTIIYRKHLQGDGYIIFPNPFKETINIGVPAGTGPVRIQVINSAGIMLYEKFSSGDDVITIPAGDFARGLYIIKIISKKGLTVSKVIRN